MSKIVHLSPSFAIAPQLQSADIGRVAELGFCAILAVRPDGEDRSSLTSRQVRAGARKAGLQFQYAPASMHEVTESKTVARFEQALLGLEGPVLAYCKSGTRAAILWALSQAGLQPLDAIRAALRRAGVDPEIIEDDLQVRQASAVASADKAKRGRRI